MTFFFCQQGDSYLDRMHASTGLGDFTRTTHTSPKWVRGSHKFGIRLPALRPQKKKHWTFSRNGTFSQVPRFVDNPRKGQFTRQYFPCSQPSMNGCDPYGVETPEVNGKLWHQQTRALVTSDGPRMFPPGMPSTNLDPYGVTVPHLSGRVWHVPNRTVEIADTIASPKRTIFSNEMHGKLLSQNPIVSMRITV